MYIFTGLLFPDFSDLLNDNSSTNSLHTWMDEHNWPSALSTEHMKQSYKGHERDTKARNQQQDWGKAPSAGKISNLFQHFFLTVKPFHEIYFLKISKTFH